MSSNGNNSGSTSPFEELHGSLSFLAQDSPSNYDYSKDSVGAETSPAPNSILTVKPKIKILNKGGQTTKKITKVKVSGSQRKTRTFFTLGMDLKLNKLAAIHNPYQLGCDKWKDVANEMQQVFSQQFSVRTVRERISTLLEKYQQEQLVYKTGTEEEESELGSAIEGLLILIESSGHSINPQTSCDTLLVEDDEYTSQAQLKKQDKLAADKERDELLCSSYTDTAPGPNLQRKRRGILSPEDELIKRKQEHDQEVELKRIELEEKNWTENSN